MGNNKKLEEEEDLDSTMNLMETTFSRCVHTSRQAFIVFFTIVAGVQFVATMHSTFPSMRDFLDNCNHFNAKTFKDALNAFINTNVAPAADCHSSNRLNQMQNITDMVSAVNEKIKTPEKALVLQPCLAKVAFLTFLS